MSKIVGSIRSIQNLLVTTLKNNVAVNKRVYVFPGTTDQISSQLPRVTVSLISSPETFAGLGQGNNYPTWDFFTVKVDVWDKNPSNVDTIADDVLDALRTNRSLAGTNGQWFMMKANVATATTKNEQMQLYQRTINATGRWLQSA